MKACEELGQLIRRECVNSVSCSSCGISTLCYKIFGYNEPISFKEHEVKHVVARGLKEITKEDDK